MSKPFQVSMARIFASLVLLSVAIRLFVLFVNSRFDSSPSPFVIWFGFFTVGGAGIGCFVGHPIRGALAGAGMAFLLGLFFIPAIDPARE